MPEELKEAIRYMAAAMAQNERIKGFAEGVDYALKVMSAAIPQEKEAPSND